MNGKWIWLPKDRYPEYQECDWNSFEHKEDHLFTVAEFEQKYEWNKKAVQVSVRFSGDTDVQLFCNHILIGTGPVCVGGDFIGNEGPRPEYYASEAVMNPNCSELIFNARVRMSPVLLCDYSKGHGGFMMAAHILFEDGSEENVITDHTWKVRKNNAYYEKDCFDAGLGSDAYVQAEEIKDIWNVMTAPIPVRTEEMVWPSGGGFIELDPWEEKEVTLQLDKIYAGFLYAEAVTFGELKADIYCREFQEEGKRESLRFCGREDCERKYRGFRLQSAGEFRVRITNQSERCAQLKVGMIATCYPVAMEAKTVTGDEDMNLVLDVCRHTLKYCRQTHHLDSPRHCEPLACSGDYYIESLMTAFSFGDMRLAEFDLIRTAGMLQSNDGRIFHTTYSLIWVKWLYDVYMITGNIQLLQQCVEALDKLLHRFTTYIGENGLIETPPDYMFVDWIYIDEISMHHPPKALGQTCLNLFYYCALEHAAYIYEELGRQYDSANCKEKSIILKESVNTYLYDEEKGLYFEGLNTETPEELLYQYMPQNVEKRYYLKQSNILAAYTGICDKDRAVSLIHKIMSGECPGDYQPYFAHFLLEAIYKNGLREQYTLKELEKWKEPVKECPKGLVEGFVVPEPAYSFDHSHAWGGTPLYSLSKALTGLKILKPGMKEVSFDPSLLGMKYATVEIPTVDGMYVCELKENEEPSIIFHHI